MLAVIQQQRGFPSQVVRQRLHQRLTGLFPKSQRRGDLLHHQGRIGQRRQLDLPHPIRIRFHQVRRKLQRQAGLAAAARADERQQTRLFQ